MNASTAVVALALLACYRGDDPTRAPIKAPLLHNAYLANPIAADAQYKGKTIAVAGQVVKIEKQGDRYVVLLAVTAGLGGSFPGVEGTIAKGHEAEFAAVRPNQFITFVGTCRSSQKTPRGWEHVLVEVADVRLAK